MNFLVRVAARVAVAPLTRLMMPCFYRLGLNNVCVPFLFLQHLNDLSVVNNT
jgi:hypothetical protein